MATTNRREIELNPVFAVPPGVIDVRQENSDDSSSNYEGGSLVGPGDGPILSTPDAPVPNAPSRYTIVSQTLRTSPDGRTVVDVLLEFPDVNGINVDVAVTPV